MTTLKQLDRLNQKLNGYKKLIAKKYNRPAAWQRITVDKTGALYAVTEKGWSSGNLFDYNESTLIGQTVEQAAKWIEMMRESMK